MSNQAASVMLHTRFNKLFSILLLCLLAVMAGISQAADDFLDPDEAFQFSAAMVDPLSLDVHYEIAPDYYVYQERFEVKITDASGNLLLLRESTLFPDEDNAQPLWDTTVQIPKGVVKYDPTFEQNMEVFHNQVTLRIPLQLADNNPLNVMITSQGCADSGLCYPPMQHELQLQKMGNGYIAVGDNILDTVPAPQDEATPAASPASVSVFDMGDMGMAQWLHAAPFWQIILLSIVFGALLSLTPCVLPMVPILLAVIAGQSGPTSRFKGFLLAAVYVLGMSLVYTVLGVVAGLMGAGLAAWLQSPWVLGSFAILLAIFALAMLDVFTLQTPTGMQSSLQNMLQKMPGGQFGSVFIMGAVSALIVGPCVAAPLAGILLFISQTGDVVIGGTSLFAMAWGEGLLLLAVGAGAGVLIPKAGAWMNTLKYGFGILLLATAWWMARPLLWTELYISGWVILLLWLGLLLWYTTAAAIKSGVAIGAIFLRALAAVFILWAAAQLAGLFAGGTNMLQPLAPFTGSSAVVGSNVSVDPAAIRARFTRVTDLADLNAKIAETDRPVMLDFYADWCVSCLEMEKFTFSDPVVAEQMNGVLLLQADVTKMTTSDRELLAQFNLFGPPGIIFFGRDGAVLDQYRVVGFKKAADFSAILESVLAG